MGTVPFYHLYEMNHALLGPFRAAADATRMMFQNPFNPLSMTPYGRNIAAACEVFERTTRRYGKPSFDLPTTTVSGVRVPVREQVIWERPFCKLVHFEREIAGTPRRDPKVLIVAPMSGHYATLLRGTVEEMIQRHDVYITDWVDARLVPLSDGTFDLDDYIDYIIQMLHALGGDTHIIAVCQPSVPVLAAVSIMEENDDPYAPSSMILMGGPIDTRISPTAVNKVAEERGLDWFRENVIMKVPFPHPGFMREVYPGFLQLSGFMSMNMDRHLIAHKDFYMHLIKGDGDSAEKHRDFYDEYLAVMDLTADFYLQTVDTVFVRYALPTGQMYHRGQRVKPEAIKNVALLTVEGELDDITGPGQTQAAHKLCYNIPADKQADYVQPGVGHYGVFNGSRFRAEIAPRIADFILTHNKWDGKRYKPGTRMPAAATEAQAAADAAEASAAAPIATENVVNIDSKTPKRRAKA
ncbi:MAG: polyhydroxyalkanoate depolymerase [Hyphomicrobiaceae bacterium]|nr:polyhydroxyalkanoate depolymerase [Hyphomicrobiaceae bacterium]